MGPMAFSSIGFIPASVCHGPILAVGTAAWTTTDFHRERANAIAPIAELQKSGVDVIITDHHGTTENVADAFAALNPRLPDAGYPDRDLAGCGVAFTLVAAIAESLSGSMRQSSEFADYLIDAMGYIAMGTVADVAPAVWLGYVARADYVAALDADGRPHHVPQDATVTPGSDRSWLSKAVRWTKLADLSLAWWQQHIEGAV